MWRSTSAPFGHALEADGHALLAPVLVLNASYEPINICAARRAIVLVLKGLAMPEEENGHFLHAARLAMRVPSVIRLLEYRRIPRQTRALSRKNTSVSVATITKVRSRVTRIVGSAESTRRRPLHP